MIKFALACDCDDTLYFRERNPAVRATDILAVQAVRHVGGAFGISTGRPYYGVLEAIGGLIDFDFHICTSGAHILDSSGAVLEEHTLPRELIDELWNMGKNSTFMVVHANGRLYSPRPTSSFQLLAHSLEEIPGNNFYGISFYANSPEKAAAMAAFVNRKWEYAVNAFHNNICMDVVAHDVSKGKAILHMKAILGTPLMAAIGDSYNDISMLQAADYSFTFPYAPPEVRKAASCVVSTVEAALEILQHS